MALRSGHRRRLGGGVALVGLALLALLLAHRAPDSAPSAVPRGLVPEAEAADTKHDVAPASEKTGRAAIPLGAPATRTEFLERMRRERTAYKNASRFPHWSYPLTPDMGFLLEWNKGEPSEVPFNEDKDPIHVSFDADRGRVMYGEALTSWLEAWRDDHGKRVAVPATVQSARVTLTSGPKSGTAIPLEYNDAGRDGDVVAGDFRATSSFVPHDHPELSKSAQARLETYVEINGELRRFVRDFVYTPRPTVTVVSVADHVRNGSLVVTATVTVAERGVYTFYANLMSGDGTKPISTTKLTYPLEAGTTTADLVFFGKTIFEAGLDGPYQVRDVHGLKRQEGDEMDMWFSDARTFTTAPYALTEMSPAEWDADERKEKLAHFDRIVSDLERAR